MSKGKIVVALLVILACAAGGGWYLYKTKIQKHYLITAAEEFLSERMKSPSSYKTKKIVFRYDENIKKLLMNIQYEAANSFGVNIQGYASFYFECSKFQPSFLADKSDTSYIDLMKKSIQTEIISPFVRAKITRINIDGKDMDEIDMMSYQATKAMAAIKYSGPKLGGRITAISDDGTPEIEYGLMSYNPSKIFPYEYHQ